MNVCHVADLTIQPSIEPKILQPLRTGTAISSAYIIRLMYCYRSDMQMTQ